MSHPPWDADALAARLRAGEPVELLLFRGHRPEPDGRIGPGCLSQWWPAPFAVDGQRFATAEHYMMWRKARLFGDDVSAAAILDGPDPGEAQRLGRAVAGFEQQRWHRDRFAIVVAANVAKFGADPELRDFLLGTGDRVLVEASPVDRVWGIGLAPDDPRAGDPARWRGLNLLGFALCHARSLLSEQDCSPGVQRAL
ncbi:NADAR family protein [Prauserella cavernicola]|uniref:NADAR family protein n=1 Tax=Prauserella cavernicola TaxID=2800127 RepID=A0A934QX06_9PSEU|nr:NADAR family protein [Prauserella cavernicola]MBK1787712.1 NADAR family protein [Prauserella cavernicola]